MNAGTDCNGAAAPRCSSVLMMVNGNTLYAISRGYEQQYPETAMGYEQICKRLLESYFDRIADKARPGCEYEDYHVEVCSDWQDRIYVFSYLGESRGMLYFNYKELYKL